MDTTSNVPLKAEPASTPVPCDSSRMQQMPDASAACADGSGAISAQVSTSSADFEEFLLSIMQEEAQKCLQEQRQQELMLMGAPTDGAISDESLFMLSLFPPAAATTNALSSKQPTMLTPECMPTSGCATPPSPTDSDQGSNSSSTIPEADAWAQGMAAAEAAAAANEASAQRRQLLQQQLRDLEMRLQSAGGPGPMPAHSAAFSCLGAGAPLHASSLLQQQQQHAAAAAALARQQEAAMAARMAQLQGQLQSVQAQIIHLRQVLEGGFAAPQPSCAASASAVTGCPSGLFFV